MDTIFLKILNMSINSSWLILAVIVLRFVLKKTPKNIRCILWAFVGIRLVCPFSFESMLSVIPSAETVSPDIIYAETPAIDSGIPIVNQAVNPIVADALKPVESASINPIQVVLFVAEIVWVIGIAAMLLYSIISYLRLRRKTAVSMNLRENIFLCDNISSPFILGVFRPRVFLPSEISEPDLNYVSAHEKAHLKRLDFLWKPLGFAILAVHWFNPLAWIAYILFCRDIELSCDEKVIKNMDSDNKKAYSETLLAYSTTRGFTACPVAFGEVGVKERVKGVLNYKKPAFWVIIVAVIACAMTGFCLLTNPKNTEENHVEEPSSQAEPVTEVTDGETFKKFAEINGKTEEITYTWKDCGDFYIGIDEEFKEGKIEDTFAKIVGTIKLESKKFSDCYMMIDCINLGSDDGMLDLKYMYEETTIAGYKAYTLTADDEKSFSIIIQDEDKLINVTTTYDGKNEDIVQRMRAMLDTIVIKKKNSKAPEQTTTTPSSSTPKITVGETFQKTAVINGKTENVTYTWNNCGDFTIGVDEKIEIAAADNVIVFGDKDKTSSCGMLVFSSDKNVLQDDFAEIMQDTKSEKTTFGGYPAYVSKGTENDSEYIDIVIVGETKIIVPSIMYYSNNSEDKEIVDRMYAMLDTIVIN